MAAGNSAQPPPQPQLVRQRRIRRISRCSWCSIAAAVIGGMAITWGRRPRRWDGALDRIPAAAIRRLSPAAIRRLPAAAIRRPSPGGKAPPTSLRNGSELAQFSLSPGCYWQLLGFGCRLTRRSASCMTRNQGLPAKFRCGGVVLIAIHHQHQDCQFPTQPDSTLRRSSPMAHGQRPGPNNQLASISTSVHSSPVHSSLVHSSLVHSSPALGQPVH